MAIGLSHILHFKRQNSKVMECYPQASALSITKVTLRVPGWLRQLKIRLLIMAQLMILGSQDQALNQSPH